MEVLGYPTAIVDVLLCGGEQLVVYRRPLPPWTPRSGSGPTRWASASPSPTLATPTATSPSWPSASSPGPARPLRIKKTMTEPDGGGVRVVTSEASRAREPLRRGTVRP